MEYLILVNTQNPLPRSYIPRALVQDARSKIWLEKAAYQGFHKMNKDLKASGLEPLLLVSGYRSFDYQQEVFDRKVGRLIKDGLDKNKARDLASKVVAVPGTSEHQTGLAMDLTSSELAKKEDPLIEGFAQTDLGKWLDANAHQYGFILRYPKDKTKITHIIYEPWHYRYVGIFHAQKMRHLTMCLEEYISYLDYNKY